MYFLLSPWKSVVGRRPSPVLAVHQWIETCVFRICRGRFTTLFFSVHEMYVSTLIQLRVTVKQVKRLQHVHESADPNIAAHVCCTACASGQVCGEHTEKLQLYLMRRKDTSKWSLDKWGRKSETWILSNFDSFLVYKLVFVFFFLVRLEQEWVHFLEPSNTLGEALTQRLGLNRMWSNRFPNSKPELEDFKRCLQNKL